MRACFVSLSIAVFTLCTLRRSIYDTLRGVMTVRLVVVAEPNKKLLRSPAFLVMVFTAQLCQRQSIELSICQCVCTRFCAIRKCMDDLQNRHIFRAKDPCLWHRQSICFNLFFVCGLLMLGARHSNEYEVFCTSVVHSEF